MAILKIYLIKLMLYTAGNQIAWLIWSKELMGTRVILEIKLSAEYPVKFSMRSPDWLWRRLLHHT